MARPVTTSLRVPPEAAKGNTKMAVIDPDVLKGSLVSRRSSLAKWSRAHRFNRSQVSRALHGHRSDRRSQEILAALEKEIGR
ncbi:MAG: hypothetical protein NT105_23840 [Verrucomicrobia bacterium]|nr:hypothetical protein [Verrucomicrobiota bacterium]